jgi:hypothetical protein
MMSQIRPFEVRPVEVRFPDPKVRPVGLRRADPKVRPIAVRLEFGFPEAPMRFGSLRCAPLRFASLTSGRTSVILSRRPHPA